MIERQVKQYENGLKHVHYFVPFVKTLSLGFVVKAGGADELRTEQYGIAHFLEHMMFNGSEKYPDTTETDKLAASLGLYQNAWTWNTETVYYLQSSQESFGKAFDILFQRVFHPLLKEDDVKKEIGIIQEERVMYENDPKGFLTEEIWTKMNKGSTYDHRTIGTKESIDGMNKDLLHEFHHLFYSPGNIVFITYGGVKVDFVDNVVRKSLDELVAVEFPDHQIIYDPKKKPEKGFKEIIKRDVDINYYSRLVKADPPKDLSQLASNFIINSFLSYGNASLLNQELLSKRSLVSNYDMNLYLSTDLTLIEFQCSYTKENEKEIYDFISSIFMDPLKFLSIDDFDRARNYATGVLIRNIEDVQFPIGESPQNVEFFNFRKKKDHSYLELLDEIKKIDYSNVKDYTEKLFSSLNWAEGFVAPK